MKPAVTRSETLSTHYTNYIKSEGSETVLSGAGLKSSTIRHSPHCSHRIQDKFSEPGSTSTMNALSRSPHRTHQIKGKFSEPGLCRPHLNRDDPPCHDPHTALTRSKANSARPA